MPRLKYKQSDLGAAVVRKTPGFVEYREEHINYKRRPVRAGIGAGIAEQTYVALNRRARRVWIARTALERELAKRHGDARRPILYQIQKLSKELNYYRQIRPQIERNALKAMLWRVQRNIAKKKKEAHDELA